MIKRILFIIYIFNSLILFSQGFYDSHEAFLNTTIIKKLNICRVTATSDYSDSNFHYLSNFVFEYTFDNAGKAIYKKSWNSELDKKNDKYLILTLIKDSVVSLSSGETLFISLSKSNQAKFNQHRNRNKNYITKFFRTFETMYDSNNKRCLHYWGSKNPLVDTILFAKKVCIPKWLIPFGDSISIINDTIQTFSKSKSTLSLTRKYYLSDGKIKIDCMSQDDNSLWESYSINNNGFIDEEIQNKYKTIYYYNVDGLHIKTESYLNEYMMTQTIFTYEIGCG